MAAAALRPQEYILGTYWKKPQPEAPAEGGAEPSVAETLRAELRGEIVSETANKRAYFKMRYGNGTLCDKTGKPREVEVRLSCGPGEGLQISLIEEVSTCAYVFHVRTDRLCRHPAFEAERAKETSLPVKCEPLGEDGTPLPAAPKRDKPPPTAAGEAAIDSAQAALQSAGAAGAAGAALSPLSAVAAAAAGVLAAASPNDVAYGVGQCFLHRRQNYRGVIVGVDRECRQSEAWVSAMHVGQLKHGRTQPFYHVLADTRDRPGDGIGYVPQELLLLDTPPEPLQHPLTASLFGSYDARRGRFLLKGGGAAEGEGAAAEDALSAVVGASAQGLSITVTSGGQQQAVEPGEEEEAGQGEAGEQAEEAVQPAEAAAAGEAGQDGGGWVIIEED